MSAAALTLRAPDDWHVHLRDGALLAPVLADTARHFARAIVMPNLQPPVVTTAQVAAYRARIRAALPPDADFEPLMTAYLTDTSAPADLVAGARAGVLTAVKYYPAGATTNAHAGVTDIARLDHVFEALAAIGLPLLVHGEVTDREVDVFDREAVFIERVLEPLRRRHPGLKVVFEHITTVEAVAYVAAADPSLLAATVTPHHLVLNRNAMFQGGLRPHHYCLPLVKRERHRAALVAAVTRGDPHFFLGTDSAPHQRPRKEQDCGCAGIYNTPVALAIYAEVFAQAGALAHLEAFAALNGPRFYALPVNQRRITLTRGSAANVDEFAREVAGVVVFEPPVATTWQVSRA